MILALQLRGACRAQIPVFVQNYNNFFGTHMLAITLLARSSGLAFAVRNVLARGLQLRADVKVRYGSPTQCYLEFAVTSIAWLKYIPPVLGQADFCYVPVPDWSARS